MKSIWKYLVGIMVVVLFVGYVLFTRQSSDSITPPNPPLADNTGSSGMPTSTNIGPPGGSSTGAGSTGTGGGTGNAGSGSTGMYKNGTYTGSPADAFYGTLQVAAVISGGKLTDVQFLQYPNDNGHSQEVSGFALPQLKQEAIAAQSANVNIVSGATQTSGAFQQSLGDALSQAKA